MSIEIEFTTLSPQPVPWHLADFDINPFCLTCGEGRPCMTEADLAPGDPGVPCLFELEMLVWCFVRDATLTNVEPRAGVGCPILPLM